MKNMHRIFVCDAHFLMIDLKKYSFGVLPVSFSRIGSIEKYKPENCEFLCDEEDENTAKIEMNADKKGNRNEVCDNFN